MHTTGKVGSVLDLLRIGEKVIDRERVHRLVDRLFTLRQGGASQNETARALGTDRTLVSRLETLGEVRKGGRMALVGFPVGNKEELETVAQEQGVDLVFLLTEAERWAYVREKNGLELVNEIMEIITRLRAYDVVIFLGSTHRIQLVEAMLDQEVVGLDLGPSPISVDVKVDPEELRGLLQGLNPSPAAAAETPPVATPEAAPGERGRDW